MKRLIKQGKWKIRFHQTFENLSKTQYPCLIKMFDAFASAFKIVDCECFPDIRKLINEAVPLIDSHELQELPQELVV